MAACQREIALGQGDFAEKLMGLQQRGAAVEQPSQLVDGDVDLPGLEHGLDFFHVFGPLRNARRIDQLEGLMARQPAHAQPVGGASGRLALALAFSVVCHARNVLRAVAV